MNLFFQSMIVAAAGLLVAAVWKASTTVIAEQRRKRRVLDAIAEQFQTDSGSSLRDLVNRLEASIGQLTVTVADIVTDRQHVADDLAVDRGAVRGVADALATSRHRADNVASTEHSAGAVADAAASSPINPE